MSCPVDLPSPPLHEQSVETLRYIHVCGGVCLSFSHACPTSDSHHSLYHQRRLLRCIENAISPGYRKLPIIFTSKYLHLPSGAYLGPSPPGISVISETCSRHPLALACRLIVIALALHGHILCHHPNGSVSCPPRISSPPHPFHCLLYYLTLNLYHPLIICPRTQYSCPLLPLFWFSVFVLR